MTLDAAAEADALEALLAAQGTPERAEKEKAYLKSDLRFHGATLPQINAAVRAFQQTHPDLAHDDVVDLVDALWREPVSERRMAAVELLDRYQRVLTVADLDLVERLLRESKTWALVDGLAASVAGALVDRDRAGGGPVADRWSGDGDFWVRRAALLALLPGVRAGRGDLDRLSRFADAMLSETEFFIRKAIGWVLRDASRKDPAWVAAWVERRLDRMSGVTFREAVRRLPDDERVRLVTAYGELRPKRRPDGRGQR